MFTKHRFQIKNSSKLKYSESKLLFPEFISNCFNKQQLVKLKVQFTYGSNAVIYLLEKEPMIFQDGADKINFFPSVYFLWSFPTIFPILFIQHSTFGFLKKGADLMIPGIELINQFPKFEENCPVGISTICKNKEGNGYTICGPLAVGKVLFSSDELKEKIETGQKGKGVEILHIFGDFLWESGSRRSFPQFMSDCVYAALNPQASQNDETDNLYMSLWNFMGKSILKEDDQLINLSAENISSKLMNEAEELLKIEETSLSSEEMDNLLFNIFFSAIKYQLTPASKFPFDAGQFYANYIIKNIPVGKKLEIKRTSYKKFTTFLEEINNNENGWVVKVKTIKSINFIENINFDHPYVQNALPFDEDFSNSDLKHLPSQTSINIYEQMFSLTEQVMPIFRSRGHRRGDLVNIQEIRSILLEYSKEKNLILNDGKDITLDDDTLQMVVKYFLPETFPVKILIQKLCEAMTKAVLVKTVGGRELIYRGKVPNIEFKVEKRSGNKIVTLVNNLAAFGIEAKDIAKEIKGTGTSIFPNVLGCEGPQLLIQGNEVNEVTRLLVDMGITKKFIKGIDLGVKEKKKK
uniref:SUI1 domain-containing protein n=1 Tax=Meloidogyne incognita TaxID=6306 RepID=A0A914LDQ1_MELIC